MPGMGPPVEKWFGKVHLNLLCFFDFFLLNSINIFYSKSRKISRMRAHTQTEKVEKILEKKMSIVYSKYSSKILNKTPG
jgi:hypothetical protein